jgi:hypothetical protein
LGLLVIKYAYRLKQKTKSNERKKIRS